MSGSSAQASEPVPDCPKCGRPMVRRTARRGANANGEFWGCSEFPRCRGIVQGQPPVDAQADEDASAAVQSAQDNVEEASGPDAGDKPRGFLTRVVQTIDKGHRWYLERDEPDATGRWDADHRRRMLSYIHTRDGGRCGLCAGETKQKGAQIEHIVPKVFAVFDIGKGGKAEPAPNTRAACTRSTTCRPPTPTATSARATPPRSTSGVTRPCRRSPSRMPTTDELSCCPGSRRLDWRANSWEPSAP